MSDRLRAVIAYDPVTGSFTRLSGTGGTGNKNAAGYIQMNVAGKFYYGHRLAWWFVHGEWPKSLDHINGDKADNRIANLRLATQRQNAANARRHRPNGLKGTWWKAERRKWAAAIRHDGRKFHLGTFDDEQSAHAAYCEAARRLKGEFARFD